MGFTEQVQEITVGLQEERYELAAELRDRLRDHPENVARQAREELEMQLQAAVRSEDFEACLCSTTIMCCKPKGAFPPKWGRRLQGIAFGQARIRESQISSLVSALTWCTTKLACSPMPTSKSRCRKSSAQS
jgi:hypothetical protein